MTDVSQGVAPAQQTRRAAMRNPATNIGWDALLLVVLVFALLEIVGFAEVAALPNLVQDVLRHPLLGRLLAWPRWEHKVRRPLTRLGWFCMRQHWAVCSFI